MTTAAYTHAENAQFFSELANKFALPNEHVERLNDLAAKEAEKDPAYVAYVNMKVRATLASAAPTHTRAEMREKIKSW